MATANPMSTCGKTVIKDDTESIVTAAAVDSLGCNYSLQLTDSYAGGHRSHDLAGNSLISLAGNNLCFWGKRDICQFNLFKGGTLPAT